MALEIFNEEDQMTVTNLFILIYGDPGVGKTSLANTAANPGFPARKRKPEISVTILRHTSKPAKPTITVKEVV
jgi:GTPase SAR1 family protein